MIPCPRATDCRAEPFPHVGALSAHLVDVHLVGGAHAVRLAREAEHAATNGGPHAVETTPAPPVPAAPPMSAQSKEETMPKLPAGAPRQRAVVTCSKCGTVGHNARACGAEKKAAKAKAPTGGGHTLEALRAA